MLATRSTTPPTPPQEKDIVDARLKKAASKHPSAPAPLPRVSTPDSSATRKSTSDLSSSTPSFAQPQPPAAGTACAVRQSMPAFTLPPELSGRASPVRPSRDVITDLLEAPTPSINTIRSRFAPASATGPEPAPGGLTASSAVRMLSSGDRGEVLAGFKHISGAFSHQGGAPAGEVSALRRDADGFACAVQQTIALHLAKCADPDEYRLVKHAVYAAHTVFSTAPEVCAAVGDAPLSHLVEELLVRLHDDQLPPSEEVDVLMRGLNELVMDVLHSAKPNAVYTLLVRFLYEGAPLSGGRESSPEFTDGVLR